MDSDQIQDVEPKKSRRRRVKVEPVPASVPVAAPVPVIETTEARRGYETTVAFRLQVALHDWTCSNCKANCPGVYRTDRRTRYVRCRRCGADGKIVV